MEQVLVIVRIEEIKDGDRQAKNRERMLIPLSELKPGAEIDLSAHRKMSVKELNAEELVFNVDNRSYVLNRYWQVLGTVKMDVPSDFSYENERFTFHFETPVEQAEDGLYGRMVDMMETMRKNSDEGKLWKNIPLAREMMHLFKDCTPLRDEEINPIVRMSGVNAIGNKNIISVNDTPRLYLSYLEYWEICNDLVMDGDGEVSDPKYFVSELDKQLFQYTTVVDPSFNFDTYEEMFGRASMLRFDPVQLTPKWEEKVYDIELETEREVGSEYKGMGFCFIVWSAKTKIASRYGFRWRSPQVMNPRVRFD